MTLIFAALLSGIIAAGMAGDRLKVEAQSDMPLWIKSSNHHLKSMLSNQKLVSRTLSGVIAAAAVGGSLSVEAQNAKQIGSNALWGPGMTEMQMIRQGCASTGSQFGKSLRSRFRAIAAGQTT